MKIEKPQMYYKPDGNNILRPHGYRVGISDGVYGICPFCGKGYTEQDIQNNEVNFEHVYPRLGMQFAIKEKRAFKKIESEFMVAVHQKCNADAGEKLEKVIKGLIENLNKPRARLNIEQACALINYCRKTSIFLQYLEFWDEIQRSEFCYENEKYDLAKGVDNSFYKNFDLKIRYVNESATFEYGDFLLIDKPKEQDSSFRMIIGNLELVFYHKSISTYYRDNDAIFISPDSGKLLLLYGTEYPDYTKQKDILLKRKSISWKLNNLSYDDNLYFYENLILGDTYHGPIRNYNVRQRKLANGGKIQPEDRGIVYPHDGKIYLVDDNVIPRDISTLPFGTKIEQIHLSNVSPLPDMSHLTVDSFDCDDCVLESLKILPKGIKSLVVMDNKLTTLEYLPERIEKIVVSHNNITSLKGAPKHIDGFFACDNNELTNLTGAPTFVGTNFDCSKNHLESLIGAPAFIGGNFNCSDNPLKSLIGAPKHIGGEFVFSTDNLDNLDGLPVAKSYVISDKAQQIYFKTFNSEAKLRAYFLKMKLRKKIKKVSSSVKRFTKYFEKTPDYVNSSWYRQEKLEKGAKPQPKDKGVVYSYDGKVYLVDDNGVPQDITTLPYGTKIEQIHLSNVSPLPDMSHLTVDSFDCDYCVLESLKKIPQHINDGLSLFYVDLKSLDGVPRRTKYLLFSHNKLTTLMGLPKHVEYLFVTDNELTSLKGIPTQINGISLSNNKITSLKGAPKHIDEFFACDNNELTNLTGAPTFVGTHFDCSKNHLESLIGAPAFIGGNFNCSGNPLKSLTGAPKRIGGEFCFSVDYLDNLEDLPVAKSYRVTYKKDSKYNSQIVFLTSVTLRAYFYKRKVYDKMRKVTRQLKAKISVLNNKPDSKQSHEK